MTTTEDWLEVTPEERDKVREDLEIEMERYSEYITRHEAFLGYFNEYTTRHEAMALLWGAWDKSNGRLRGRIVRAIAYIRDTAFELIPYGATTPNKSYSGHHGRRV